MKKEKIKSKTKGVSVYLTDNEYEELIRITNEKNISLSDYLKDAMNMKFRIGGDELEDEVNISLSEYNDILKDLRWNFNLLIQLGEYAEHGTKSLAEETRNMIPEIIELLAKFRIKSIENDTRKE